MGMPGGHIFWSRDDQREIRGGTTNLQKGDMLKYTNAKGDRFAAGSDEGTRPVFLLPCWIALFVNSTSATYSTLLSISN